MPHPDTLTAGGGGKVVTLHSMQSLTYKERTEKMENMSIQSLASVHKQDRPWMNTSLSPDERAAEVIGGLGESRIGAGRDQAGDCDAGPELRVAVAVLLGHEHEWVGDCERRLHGVRGCSLTRHPPYQHPAHYHSEGKRGA